jgi:hypothetical protein
VTFVDLSAVLGRLRKRKNVSHENSFPGRETNSRFPECGRGMTTNRDGSENAIFKTVTVC